MDEEQATLRELVTRVDQRAFKRSGNPFYVWATIARYGPEEPLPPWVQRYLITAAHDMLRVVNNPKVSSDSALKRVLHALGFTRQGWSAISDYRFFNRQVMLLAMLRRAARGTSDSYVTQWAKRQKISPRHVRRLIAKARHRGL
jgi:hypothetical protein